MYFWNDTYLQKNKSISYVLSYEVLELLYYSIKNILEHALQTLTISYDKISSIIFLATIEKFSIFGQHDKNLKVPPLLTWLNL